MVKKIGKSGLPTGNTIRKHLSSSRLRQYQNYSYLVVNSDIRHEDVLAQSIVSDITKIVSSKVHEAPEFSLNKRRRWELPERLKGKIQEEQDSTDLKITLMEHTLTPTVNMKNGEWDTCDTYYCNTGSVRERVSNSEMSVTSAKRGRIAEDHLSKAERRKLKRKPDFEEQADEPSVPSYQCHVVYGVPFNGALSKRMPPKGIENANKRSRNVTAGCSKRFLHRHGYTDDELSLYSDEVFGAESDEHTTYQPIAVPLSDFLVTTSKQNKHRTRKCSGSSTGSGGSAVSTTSSTCSTASNTKDRVVYLDEPIYPDIPVVPTLAPSTGAPVQAYLPDSTIVFVKRCDVDMETILLNFGDKYRESYSTPRTITLDLSDDLGATAKNNRLYLVMILHAEDKEFDLYRVYRTGSCISTECSGISAIEDGHIYDLLTLKSLVLSSLDSETDSHSAATSASTIRSSKQKGHLGAHQWNVGSSNLSELAQQTISQHHRQTEINLKNYQASTRDLVFIPNQLQRSMSCALHCGICFEELNDKVLHSALLPCQHYFCNECWSVHVHNAVREGVIHITCPEYECKREVDIVFLMSMLNFSTYCLHEQHLTEFSLFSQKKAIWCPSKSCDKVLHCDDNLAAKDDPITASCKCGNECCFKCLKEPHWPLTCEQFTNYHTKLNKNGLGNIANFGWEESEVVVHTKACPKCKTVIEKDGGCPHMVCCKCNSAFCWTCCQLYVGTQYFHDCKGVAVEAERREFSFSLSTCGSHYYKEACRHRVYKAKYKSVHLRKLVRDLLSTTPTRKRLNLPEENESQTLCRLLNQITSQILATHNLLEYCCSVNVFKKGSKYCVPTISLLSYSVDVLERQLSSGRCNQYTVDRLVKYYVIVKSNTQLLVHKMSQLLSLVKPSTTQ